MLLNIRQHVVSAALKAQVGEVDGVDGALVVVAYHARCGHEKEVAVALFAPLFVDGFQRNIFIVHRFTYLGVETFVGEIGRLYHQNGGGGVCLT